MTDSANGADTVAMFPATTCPVEMGGRPDGRCGRPLHSAPAGADARPVCVMHSRDEGKAAAPLLNVFFEEALEISSAAGEGAAHFDGFVFPMLIAKGGIFSASCIFDGAVFVGKVDLFEAVFQKEVSFARVQFESEALLWLAKFQSGVSFRQAKFGGSMLAHATVFAKGADFSGAVFGGEATLSQVEFNDAAQFEEARFEGDTYFSGTIFAEAKFAKVSLLGDASFDACEFNAEADFTQAAFTKEAKFQFSSFVGPTHFGAVTFGGNANFTYAKFLGKTYFRGARFDGPADFSKANFADELDIARAEFKDVAQFSGATFKGPVLSARIRYGEKATFSEATFHETANWAMATFMSGVEFRDVHFELEGPAPSVVFSLASFVKPHEVVFDDVDMSRVLFHNCDVSEVRFTSSVKWGERDRRSSAAVFEETIALNQDWGRTLVRKGERDFRAIAKIYQQLKKNYDGSLDYWMADQFHFGEMEMKRLAVDADKPLYGFRKWLMPRLGLVAWYRYASDYGNSYVKPIAWMIVLLLGFAALYPMPGVGLLRSGVGEAETYADVWQTKATTFQNVGQELELVGRSLLAAIEVAGFQKSPEYSPAYPWGRVVGIVETVLTSTLFGLFLLAIRRQFRR